MLEERKLHFFWHGPFSQWHMSQFDVEGGVYNCCEQYMMAQKALLFNDKETYECIMQSDSPRVMKALGRTVKNFDKTTWNAVARTIVFRANMAKFTQDPQLLKMLLDTGDEYLVEASPYDKVWGIGLAATDPDAQSVYSWKGENWLGRILTEVRDQIKCAISCLT